MEETEKVQLGDHLEDSVEGNLKSLHGHFHQPGEHWEHLEKVSGENNRDFNHWLFLLGNFCVGEHLLT